MSLFLKIPRRRQFVYSTALVLAVAALCFSVPSLLHYRVVALILLLTVSLLAVSFDILPVLIAAVLSALIWDVFFIPPRFTFHVDTAEDTMLLAMYFVIAMINGILTHQIRRAEKVAALKEEKANSVKLYNTILNSLSHELRTPLATIIGAADNLQLNRNLKPADADTLVDEISKAALRLNQQVENLLNISRLESGHIQPKKDWCDVAELCYDIVRQVEENNLNRKIHISINPGMPLCYTDAGMVQQILYNLVNNAVVHTQAGTRVWLSASCHGDLLEFTVEDDGNRLDTEDLTQFFYKFSRQQHAGTGSGLGLSIVKGFTDALNGRVAVSKRPGNGPKFTISLPVRTA